VVSSHEKSVELEALPVPLQIGSLERIIIPCRSPVNSRFLWRPEGLAPRRSMIFSRLKLVALPETEHLISSGRRRLAEITGRQNTLRVIE
jgi:hypothetical protein